MYKFTGKIVEVSPITKATGKYKEKCIFIIEGEKERKIAFILFDASIELLLGPHNIGSWVEVTFTVKSSKLQGSWVTSCFALKVELVHTESNSKKQYNNSFWEDIKSRANSRKGNTYFPAGTTKEEAKRIYRDLCKKYHPDMPGGSTEKMQEINKLYEKFK